MWLTLSDRKCCGRCNIDAHTAQTYVQKSCSMQLNALLRAPTLIKRQRPGMASRLRFFAPVPWGVSTRASERWAGTAARRDQARALLTSRRIPKRMILGMKGRRFLYAKPAYEGGTSREMRIHIMCDTGIRHARGLHGCRVQKPQQGVFFNRSYLSIRHDHQPSVIPLATRDKIAVSAGIFAGARSALPAALA